MNVFLETRNVFLNLASEYCVQTVSHQPLFRTSRRQDRMGLGIVAFRVTFKQSCKIIVAARTILLLRAKMTLNRLNSLALRFLFLSIILLIAIVLELFTFAMFRDDVFVDSVFCAQFLRAFPIVNPNRGSLSRKRVRSI